MIEKNYIDLVLNIDFDDDDDFDSHFLETRISYFDHVMSEDEYCNAEFIGYVSIDKNPDKLKLFKLVEQKFVTFYKKLYELANKKAYLYNDKGKLIPLSYEKFNKHIIAAMKESPLCTIIFPSLKLFTWTGYDLTHSFFLLRKEPKQEEEMAKKLKELANSVSLHII